MDTLFKVLNSFDRVFNNSFPKEEVFYYPCEPSFPITNAYILEDSKDAVFEFSIAGYPKENIHISFENEHMILTFDKVIEEDEKRKWLLKNIKRSKAEAKYFIPQDKYNYEDVQAEISNGILKVVIPAKEIMKPKQIKIK